MKSFDSTPAGRLLAALAVAAVAGGLGLAGCSGQPMGANESTSSPPPAPPAEPAPMLSFEPIAGEWTGTVEEDHGGEIISYGVEIALESQARVGEEIGTVDYHDLGCGGALLAQEVLVRTDGARYSMEEDIRQGRNLCVDGATVVLDHTESTDNLTYEWFNPRGELKATASLKRK